MPGGGGLPCRRVSPRGAGLAGRAAGRVWGRPLSPDGNFWAPHPPGPLLSGLRSVDLVPAKRLLAYLASATAPAPKKPVSYRSCVPPRTWLYTAAAAEFRAAFSRPEAGGGSAGGGGRRPPADLSFLQPHGDAPATRLLAAGPQHLPAPEGAGGLRPRLHRLRLPPGTPRRHPPPGKRERGRGGRPAASDPRRPPRPGRAGPGPRPAVTLGGKQRGKVAKMSSGGSGRRRLEDPLGGRAAPTQRQRAPRSPPGPPVPPAARQRAAAFGEDGTDTPCRAAPAGARKKPSGN